MYQSKLSSTQPSKSTARGIKNTAISKLIHEERMRMSRSNLTRILGVLDTSYNVSYLVNIAVSLVHVQLFKIVLILMQCQTYIAFGMSVSQYSFTFSAMFPANCSGAAEHVWSSGSGSRI